MSDITYVKYCPLCGTENPRQQAFCMHCLDGDLSTVHAEIRRGGAPATQQPDATELPACEAHPAPTHCILEVVDNPSLSFTLTDGQTAGRTEKADVMLEGVPKLDWISGAHVKIFRRGDQWYAQHLGATNFIKVDGEMYKGHEEVAIYDGSILVLSLTPFRVHLGR